MNESNRNTRTLIVSFVIAIMFLIPLRFVEVGQMLPTESQVLGEETQSTEVVLPSAVVSQPELEAPYNEIESKNTTCISKEAVIDLTAANKTKIEQGNLDGVTIDRLINEMVEIEAQACK